MLLSPCCSYWRCKALAALDLFMIQKQGRVVHICIHGHGGIGTLSKSFALPQHFGCKNIVWFKMSCEKHDVRLKVDLNRTWKACPCIGMYSPFRSCISTLLFRWCVEKPSRYPQTKHHSMQSHFHPCCINDL